MSEECYDNYIKGVKNNVGTNIKHFWNFVNHRKKNHGLPDNMYLGEQSCTSGNEIANGFARQFQSIYQHDTANANLLDFNYEKTIDMNACNLNLETILNKLYQLDPNKVRDQTE
ncbi:hypothetical protein JTB14_001220 [Gonioctena quinquepunctata]|nr:hypothetical protein JTB14_001220 [Gonioctena quinquepunctata]